MDELEKKETQRRKDAEGKDPAPACLAKNGWQPLLDSLPMFSDDFMAEREQPPVQARRPLEP